MVTNMIAALHSLPDELIGLICHFCDTPDIQNLRLTCRALQNVADEHLFSEVVVFMNHDSLRTCRAIADHPAFPQGVKSLWIQADRPVDLIFSRWNEDRKRVYGKGPTSGLDREEEKALLRAVYKEMWPSKTGPGAPRMIEPKGNPSPQEQLRFGFEEALSLASESEQMLHNKALFSGLRDLLTKCSCLEAVDVTLLDTIRPCTTDKSKAFQRALLHPKGEGTYHTRRHGVDVMLKLVPAASIALFKPRFLRLGHVSHYIFEYGGVLKKLLPFFSQLEELEWHFSIPYVGTNDTEDVYDMSRIISGFNYCGNFLALMKAASCLRKLHLKLPSIGKKQCKILLSSLVGAIIWSKLTHVHLSCFATTADDLRNLLIRHAGTLTRVYLADVYLRVSLWPDCFDSIAGQLPCLQTLELRGRFGYSSWDYFSEKNFRWFGDREGKKGSKYSQRVCRYIITGVGKCPPVSNWQASGDDERFDEDDDESW